MKKYQIGLATIALTAAFSLNANAATVSNLSSGSVAVVGAPCCFTGQIFPNILLDAANNRSNFLVFDLSSLEAQLAGKDVGSATLTITQPGFYGSADPTETYTLWDYTGSVSALKAPLSGADAAAIRDDLRSGISYGSVTIPKPANGALSDIVITLDAAAIAALNIVLDSTNPFFVVGGFSDTLTGNQLLFQTSGGGPNIARIDAAAVPGPIVGAGLPGLVTVLGGLIALRRRRMTAG